LFDYLPADRTGIAWVAPTLHAYIALSPAMRHEMAARIGELAERMQAMRIVYIGRSDRESYEVAYRCAITARHTDAFLSGFLTGQPGRTRAPTSETRRWLRTWSAARRVRHAAIPVGSAQGACRWAGR